MKKSTFLKNFAIITAASIIVTLIIIDICTDIQNPKPPAEKKRTVVVGYVHESLPDVANTYQAEVMIETQNFYKVSLLGCFKFIWIPKDPAQRILDPDDGWLGLWDDGNIEDGYRVHCGKLVEGL